MTQTQTQAQQAYIAPPNDKRQRSHSFDDHQQQQQHHNNNLHHQRDDYRIDRESRDPEMHGGGNGHWSGAHLERENNTSEPQRRPTSVRSTSEEHRFNPYNRHFDTGRIHGDGGHGDRDHRNHHHRHHQNEQSPSARSNGQPVEDAEFDENISDENIQEGEDGEEDEDEEGSEENDEDGRNSKERDGTAKNEDGTCSLTFSMYHNQKPVKVRSMFVDKLFKMVEDPSIQHLISWAKEGDMFYVYNCVELSDTILPRFFKHNNWQSFVRQLNMYGFHKIYRYDREESTLNRKRPESQRWQFYHPQFQRDFPHLRANIKRKSARSMNTAPATSRVVFEHGKGYFLQRNDRSRSNSGDGPPPPPPQAGGLGHMQARHGENGSSPTSRHIAAGRQPSMNDSPRDHHHHPEGRGDTMAFPGYQRQHFHSDERYAVKASSVSPHAAHDPPHGRLPPPTGHSGFHSSSSDPHGPPSAPEERSAIAAVGHLRNRSLTRGISYEKGSLFALGADAASSSPSGPHHSGGPRVGHRSSDSALSPTSANGLGFGQPHHAQDSPHRPPRHHHHHGSMSDGPAGAPLSSSSSPRGPWPVAAAGHILPPAEAVGRDEGAAGRHGSVPPEHMRSHPALSSPPMHPQHSQQYHSNHQQQQQRHDSQHRHGRLHSMGGGAIPKDLPQPSPSLPSGSTFNTPHAPPPPSSNAQLIPPHHHAPAGATSSPTLSPSAAAASIVLPPFSGPPASGSSLSTKPGDPYVVIKELEHRLQSVEEAYMSLRQYTQKLQQNQVSQDRTIGWMRERIDQMSDAAAHGRRDSIASPLTPQSTASFSGNKRRAEPSPEDARTRARFEQQGLPPPSGPPTTATSGPPSSIQSPDIHAFEHGRGGHGRHESMSGLHHPQQQQQQHAISSPQTGPYPRLLTSLGRIYS
ncbi:hypothetical protein BGZ89_002162 [Linnemannia elongata]|nr:hypothetical protein BGZ89_002162 [Linnemannia elongata]